jgi:hypothetical protein
MSKDRPGMRVRRAKKKLFAFYKMSKYFLQILLGLEPPRIIQKPRRLSDEELPTIRIQKGNVRSSDALPRPDFRSRVSSIKMACRKTEDIRLLSSRSRKILHDIY